MKIKVLCAAIAVSIVLLANTHEAQAQQPDTLNRTDAQGRKQGYWQKRRSNGKLLYEGRFRDNQPVGLMRRYNADGALLVELDYSSTPVRARFVYPNGSTMAEGFYRQQLRDSLWRYYTESGALRYEERYRMGLRHGHFRQFYSNGKIMESALWEQGRLHGRLMQYFDNGLNRSTMSYTHGEMHGDFKVFYPNGKPRVVGFYSNGLKQNEWTYYNAHGEAIDVVVYDQGVAQGHSDMAEQDEREFQEMLRNAGKIKEPDIDDIMGMR